MSQWSYACATAEVLPGERCATFVDDTAVLLINHDGAIYALEDRCSHDDYDLSSGNYDAAAGTIECVLHGARYDLRDGSPLCPPAYTPVRKFPVKVEDGRVYIDLAVE